MRLIKRVTGNLDIIKRLKDDNFGISRNSKGWVLRLGFTKKGPSFSKYLADSKYGRMEGLRIIIQLRDDKKKEFECIGMCKGSPATKRKPLIDESGKLRKLYLSKSRGIYTWKIYYKKPNGKVIGKSFGFYHNMKVKQAFRAAVMMLKNLEIQYTGTSEIDTSIKGMYIYLNAYIKSLDKNSHKFRELRRFL